MWVETPALRQCSCQFITSPAPMLVSVYHQPCANARVSLSPPLRQCSCQFIISRPHPRQLLASLRYVKEPCIACRKSPISPEAVASVAQRSRPARWGKQR